MLYPSVQQMTNEKINRYALVIATAKGARVITEKAVREREESEARRDSKDSRPILSPESVNEKAVTLTINKLCDGEFKIVLPGGQKKN
ncbi:MAG: hypothetical protein PHW77_00865 [Eubacteriales bacterium]|nr:hypothetical protein [Eubacteriales bacterium]